MSDRFGTLRALLQQTPSEQVWRALGAELAGWEGRELEEIALPYALGHLERWPVEIARWAAHDAPSWRKRLANGIQIERWSELTWITEIEADEAAHIVHMDIANQNVGALPDVLERFVRLRWCKLSEDEDGQRSLAAANAAWPPSMVGLQIHLRFQDKDKYTTRLASALAQNPTLGGLHRLELSNIALRDDGAIALAQSPHLRSLRELDLSQCYIGPAGARALADSALLDSVEQLMLGGNNLGAGLIELMSSPHARSLKNLELDSHALPDGLELRPELQMVRSLTTYWKSDDHRSIARLLASPHLTGLRELRIFCASDDAGWEVMCGNAALSGLETLTLMTCSLTSTHLDALAASPLRPSLRCLALNNVKGDVAALFERAAWPALRELSLHGGYEEGSGLWYPPRLKDEDVARIARSGVLTGLERLELQFNLSGDTAVAALVDNGRLGSLRWLDLTYNNISDEGLIALIERGGLDSLEMLGLAHNKIGDVGAAALAQSPLMRALRPHNIERYLGSGLPHNMLTGAGALALLRSPYIEALRELAIYYNKLTHEEIVKLAAAPELARLRGPLWVTAEDSREETWQALIDSPYANADTRDYAATSIEGIKRRARQRQG
jgi:hypothetical protein